MKVSAAPDRPLVAPLLLAAGLLLAGLRPVAAQAGGGGVRVKILPGVHFQSIQRLTGSLQLLLIKERDTRGSRGVLFGIEGGTGGGKLRLGVANWAVISGSFLGLGLLRTWGHPHRVAAGQTFIGPEFG